LEQKYNECDLNIRTKQKYNKSDGETFAPGAWNSIKIVVQKTQTF